MSEEHKIVESQLKLLPSNKQGGFAKLWEYVKLAFKEVIILYIEELQRKK
jgi:hypothetical protein